MKKFWIQCNYCGTFWTAASLTDYVEVEFCFHCDEKNDFKIIKLVDYYQETPDNKGEDDNDSR